MVLVFVQESLSSSDLMISNRDLPPAPAIKGYS